MADFNYRVGKEYLKSTEAGLNVVVVMSTCKYFYDFINKHAVFYRKNVLRFDELWTLHAYLSAVTPQKLADPQNIVLFDSAFSTIESRRSLENCGILLAAYTKLEKITVAHCRNRWVINSHMIEDLIKGLRC